MPTGKKKVKGRGTSGSLNGGLSKNRSGNITKGQRADNEGKFGEKVGAGGRSGANSRNKS